MIENKRVYRFYVGHQGNFDRMVRKVLKELKEPYPQIDYAVVLAYLPKTPDPREDYSDTLYPLEGVPPKFAIDRRNEWMINRSDFLIAHVWKSWGGAAKFMRIAERKGLQVINLFQQSLFLNHNPQKMEFFLFFFEFNLTQRQKLDII